MTSFDYDLYVIGAGSGGVRAARMAAATGAKVAIAEEKYLGGTCVNVGCVPKKLFVYGSHFSEEFTDASAYGWSVNVEKYDWQTLLENKNTEIERLNGIYGNILSDAGVEIHQGRARLSGPNEVEVSGKRYSSKRILLAVGCAPTVPELEGSEHIITSDDAFYLPSLPERIVIVGGGYIAVEFAGIFNGLGVEVDLVYRGDQLLRHFDHDFGKHLAKEMQEKGITIHFNENIESIVLDEGQKLCTFASGKSIKADEVMYATGRHAVSNDLGLESAGVDVEDNGIIKVDDLFRTSCQSVFALGDVIGTPELTPVALAQAMVFVDQQFGDGIKHMSYENIPTAIFSQPAIGTVGLSEQAAKAKGIACDVYTSDFRHLKHTLTNNQERVFMKMLVEKQTQKVLGIHMIGADAGEVIQGFAVAVKAGLSKAQFDETIGIHPTAAEELVTMRQASYSF